MDKKQELAQHVVETGRALNAILDWLCVSENRREGGSIIMYEKYLLKLGGLPDDLPDDLPDGVKFLKGVSEYMRSKCKTMCIDHHDIVDGRGEVRMLWFLPVSSLYPEYLHFRESKKSWEGDFVRMLYPVLIGETRLRELNKKEIVVLDEHDRLYMHPNNPLGH